MRWEMRRLVFLAMAAAAAWWSSLLVTWVVVEERELAGVELSQTLVLLPGVCLIVLAISLYGKFSRTLLVLATLTALGGVVLALSTSWEGSAAVQSLLQETTGLLGASGQISITFGIGLFAAFGSISALLATFAATRPLQTRAAVDQPELGDSRSLWDEQL